MREGRRGERGRIGDGVREEVRGSETRGEVRKEGTRGQGGVGQDGVGQVDRLQTGTSAETRHGREGERGAK